MGIPSTGGTVVAIAGLLLAGCGTTADTPPGAYGRAGPDLPTGSEVELHETLRMPVDSARVYVQGGRVVSYSDINHFALYCSFGLERTGGEPLVSAIEPDRFEIVRAPRTWWRADAGDAEAVRVASAGVRLAGMRHRQDADRYTFYVELALRSERQPQVDDLRCEYEGQDDDRLFTPYPSAERIDAALGEVATVRSVATSGS